MKTKFVRLYGFGDRELICGWDDHENSKIAIFFPGMGYSTSASFFFYLKDELLSNGYDIFAVNTRYNEMGNISNTADPTPIIFHEGLIAFEKVQNLRNYDHFLWIGKSLGTMSIQSFIERLADNKAHSFIWCTPFLNAENLINQLDGMNNRSLVLWGTKDPYFSPELADRVRKNPFCDLVALENLDHGLCSDSGFEATLDAMKYTIARTGSFIKSLSA